MGKIILGLLALTFYFIALILGLILYLGLDQSDLMTPGELMGYATITKPEAEEIQRLMDEHTKWAEAVEQLKSEVVHYQAEITKMKAQMDTLQKEIDALEAEKLKYEKGQALATDLLSMKPQQAVATLAVEVVDDVSMETYDAFLQFFVSYAMPFMRKDAGYKKFMDGVAKDNPILATKIEMLVAAEEERNSQ